jgi:epoxide hydrolase-like predicted phosphatase
MTIRAVIFDLGGVVVGSPLRAIADFERARGIPDGFINGVIGSAGSEGAWGQLERGRLGRREFEASFAIECADAGHAISVTDLFAEMAEASQPRPAMLSAIARIREQKLLAAALTNNFPDDSQGTGALRDHFDAFFESAVLGIHKPDPRIYQHACRELGIEAGEAIFLDDIGRNLKAARALGMTTLKVEAPDAALGELEALLGFTLA